MVFLVVVKHKQSQLNQNLIIKQSPKITNFVYFIGDMFQFLMLFFN